MDKGTCARMMKKAEHKRADAGRVMDRIQGPDVSPATYRKLNDKYLRLHREAEELEVSAHDAYYGVAGISGRGA